MTKVHKPQGGDQLVVERGGQIVLDGVTLAVNAAGQLVIAGLPTADPEVAGALYLAAGALKVSAGA